MSSSTLQWFICVWCDTRFFMISRVKWSSTAGDSLFGASEATVWLGRCCGGVFVPVWRIPCCPVWGSQVSGLCRWCLWRAGRRRLRPRSLCKTSWLNLQTNPWNPQRLHFRLLFSLSLDWMPTFYFLLCFCWTCLICWLSADQCKIKHLLTCVRVITGTCLSAVSTAPPPDTPPAACTGIYCLWRCGTAWAPETLC